MGLPPRPLTHFHIRSEAAKTTPTSRSCLRRIPLIRYCPHRSQGYDAWFTMGRTLPRQGSAGRSPLEEGGRKNKDSSPLTYINGGARPLRRVGRAAARSDLIVFLLHTTLLFSFTSYPSILDHTTSRYLHIHIDIQTYALYSIWCHGDVKSPFGLYCNAVWPQAAVPFPNRHIILLPSCQVFPRQCGPP